MNSSRFPFSPFPFGIFAVAFSQALLPGQIFSRTFMGKKIVLFRTQSGKIGALDAYCPHLGADLSDGEVRDEQLQCPFHGLCFTTKGHCNALNHKRERNSYQLHHWLAFEKYGLIFLQHSETPLNIHLPEWNQSGWTKPIYHYFRIESHPQEILENSVDILHFKKVHAYQSIQVKKPFKTHGPEFTVAYQLERSTGLFSDKKSTLEVQLDIHAYGLGVSMVEIILPKYQLIAKQIVMPTPIKGEDIQLFALTSLKIPDKFPHITTWLTPQWLRSFIAKGLTYFAAKGFVKDFIPDIKIWEKKKYISHPNYLPHDGDFAQYRNWCQQFY